MTTPTTETTVSDVGVIDKIDVNDVEVGVERSDGDTLTFTGAWALNVATWYGTEADNETLFINSFSTTFAADSADQGHDHRPA
jgi:hypothetical protein